MGLSIQSSLHLSARIEIYRAPFKETTMKLLHIIATPRANESNTLQTSNAFTDSLRAK
jgi:hypothetical protein